MGDTVQPTGATSGCRSDKAVCDWFLSQWLFASLLHDVGYSFFDLSRKTTEDRKAIDGLYSWEWLERLFGSTAASGRSLEDSKLNKLRNAHDRWKKKYGELMPSPTAKYKKGDEEKVIKRLASASWLCDLNKSWRGKDIFSVLCFPGKEDLRNYALEVAKKGYVNGGDGCVDHAVASGLLLFQYTSYWYWLMLELKSDPEAFEAVTGGHNYDVKNMHLFVNACRAVAYHNVQPSVSGGDKILKRVTLSKEPILFLAILCDELQNWDRYPAGEKHLRGFLDYASLEGGDIELTCSGIETRKANVRIKHRKQSAIVDKMKTTLSDRLPDYNKIVLIKEYDGSSSLST
jgi:hypothetical protein